MPPRLWMLAVTTLLAAGCAARGPSPAGDEDVIGRSGSPPLALAAEHLLAIEVPKRTEGRLGAVQLEVRLRNTRQESLSVVADPWLTELAVTGERGPIRCAPASSRMVPRPVVELAAGAVMPLRVDVGSRCYFTSAGEYDVEVSFDDGSASTPTARVRVSVAPRTWVNPGPR